MLVKATSKDRPVFLEGRKRQLDENGQDMNVIRDQPVEVPNTLYYRRQIADGDLVVVEKAGG